MENPRQTIELFLDSNGVDRGGCEHLNYFFKH